MARWEPILDEVMRERGSGLLAYARLLTGNDADAEDVFQDALVRSFSRGRTFTHVNAAEAYVRRAIPSVFIDRLRGRRTRDGADERLARAQDDATTMGDRAAVLDVRAALADLPPRERACTVPQIAAQLGLADGTVKRYLADRRGRGVARRVRTRRTVRAAGIGGTMLTAGALVVGALNMPLETKAAPGPGAATGSGDCATPWPEPYPYVVQERYADYLPEEVWRIAMSSSEEIVFMITPEDVGQTWLVTYPSGATEVVPYSGAGEVRVDVPDGPSILLSVWVTDGGTEMAVTAYSVTPGGPLIAPIDDCDAQGTAPTPSSLPVRPQ